MSLSRRHRIVILAAVAVTGIAGMALHAPIPQPADYHQFSDTRQIAGVPNFWNVVSNAPFLVVGILGIIAALRGVREDSPPQARSELRPAYLTFFLATALVAFGSALYHAAPSNATLVWDRYPIAAVIMTFLAIVLGEWIDASIGRIALFVLVPVGIASVAYWAETEQAGAGDLRPYLLVQFLPMALVPLIIGLFTPGTAAPERNAFVSAPPARAVWLLFLAYVFAKAFEVADGPIYEAGHIMSGHTLKHLAAAAGTFAFLRGFRPSRASRSANHPPVQHERAAGRGGK